MSACGYIRHSTDHVPWSSPHDWSGTTLDSPTSLITRSASSGDPGAGYCFSNKRSWEAVEIVDRARCLHRRHLRAPRFPMRRDAQDGLGCGDVPGGFLPGQAELIVFDGIHRAAVPEEQNRHLSVIHFIVFILFPYEYYGCLNLLPIACNGKKTPYPNIGRLI